MVNQHRFQNIHRWISGIIICGALILTGCTQSASPPTASDTASPVAVSPTQTIDPSALPRLQGSATVELTVKGEPIVIELDGSNAPVTAGNFVDLVQRGFYNGLTFHRVVREPEPFVAQGGDPQSKDPNFPPQQLGTGSFVDPDTQMPRYVPLEIKPEGAAEPVYGETLPGAGISAPPVLTHRRGAVAMARSAVPNSASSQFYITLADVQFLDGNYAVMGYVTSGMEVVEGIQQGDKIESATVTAGADNLVLPAESE